MPKLIVTLLAGIVACIACVASALWLASSASAEGDGWLPPPHTVIEVVGNKEDGFGVHYFDGSWIFPPTDSEAIAECGEYDTFRARVRCRAEVRTWYRDLGDMKRALRLAHLE